jgi:uncharacterized secreted protein with C-terminal beta-propeller domain
MHDRNKGHGTLTRLMSAVTLSVVSTLAIAQGTPAANSLQGSGTIRLAEPHLYADVFVEGDIVSARYGFTPQAADVGKTASLYVAARIDDGTAVHWYGLVSGKWQAWDGNMATLPAFGSKVLQPEEQLQLVDAQTLFAGDYEIYAGYRMNGGALVYSQTPMQFSVAATDSDALQRFSSAEAMEAYLKEGLQKASGRDSYLRTLAFAPTAVDIASAAGAESRTSSTNIQESGVDEADTVKVAGNNLFMLASCEERSCLQVQRLDSANATATPVSTYTLDTKIAPDGMYRVEDGILGQDMLVTVAGQYGWGWYSIWGGWQNSKTELNFLNVANPAQISRIEQLSFDGALVSSRVVDDTLYLVTRYTPALPDYIAFPVDRTQEANNAAVLARADLPQILPQVRDSRDAASVLVQSQDCYLPVSAVDGSQDPSIITITAVPLKNPTAHKSTCFLGASETLYMTPDSLYLATTSWDYDVMTATTLRYTPNHTTAVHKFALAGGTIAYRGSGTVKGHLGWHEDKKSFRMGENGAYLNIATSVGESWNETASTRLSVLKEAGGKRLETVSVLDGIGKPGEQLYAARFLGNRAYLVTFRVIDPLYVVDLSNQERPRIAGELEIEGYSDYLHPISETLLLGIGKDAVAAEVSADFGRGAWYQGVKVSLFDVANPAQPKEIDSIVLGKRGTESEVLWDHHAFSYLPPQGSEPARFAIPVRLHDRTPTWERFDASSPGAYFDYTHTALYSFEASAQGVSQAGRIIAEVAQPGQAGSTDVISRVPASSLFAPVFMHYADRSVLKDDAVFYVHEGKVLGSLWGENKTP